MTRQELRALVVLHTGRTDKTDLINSAFDLAKKQIAQIHDFGPVQVEDSTSTLLSGSSTITLPATVQRLLDPIILIDPSSSTNLLKITLKDKKWALEFNPSLGVGVSGYPDFCFIDTDGTLKFVPGASQDWTVKLNYFQKQAAATGDAEVVQVGLENSIIAWCTSYVYKSIQLYTDASYWESQFAKALQTAIADDERTDDKKKMMPFSQAVVTNQDLIPSGQNPFLGSEEQY